MFLHACREAIEADHADVQGPRGQAKEIDDVLAGATTR
jgi:hypothetical protein